MYFPWQLFHLQSPKCHVPVISHIYYYYIFAVRPFLMYFIIRDLHPFQQSFSHIAMVSGCGRELNAHFKGAALLKYHVPDT